MANWMCVRLPHPCQRDLTLLLGVRLAVCSEESWAFPVGSRTYYEEQDSKEGETAVEGGRTYKIWQGQSSWVLGRAGSQGSQTPGLLQERMGREQKGDLQEH